MKSIKRYVYIVVALLLALSLSACGPTLLLVAPFINAAEIAQISDIFNSPEEPILNPARPPLPELEPNDAVATVNGEDVTFSAYMFMLSLICDQYGIEVTDINTVLSVEEANQVRAEAVEECIFTTIMLQHGRQRGLTLTEEDKASAKEQADSFKSNLVEAFMYNIQNEIDAGAQFDDINQEAEKRAQDYIVKFKMTPEFLQTEYERNKMLEKVYQSVMDEVSPTEAEIRTEYDVLLKAQSSADTDDPQSALDAYIYSGNDVTVLVPSLVKGIYVKQAYIPLPDDVVNELYDLQTNGEDDAHKVLMDTELKKIKPTADEALAAAKIAGADFDAVVEKYNKDPGMSVEPTKTKGYLVYDQNIDLDVDFKTEVLKLSDVGEMALIKTNMGYHVLKVVGLAKPGPIPFELVRDEISEYLKIVGEEQKWGATIDAWFEEAEIVRIDKNYQE